MIASYTRSWCAQRPASPVPKSSTLAGPALATLGILTFLASWNNFLWPLVVAQNEETYTLPVALALYSVGQNSTQYGLLLAGATVVVLPILIVFLVFQRRFIEGIATTGIK